MTQNKSKNGWTDMKTSTAVAILISGLVSCSGYKDKESVSTQHEGTSLSVAALRVSSPICNADDTANVNLSGVLTTVGSTDLAFATAQIDGGARQLLDIVDPEEFVNLRAQFSVDATVPQGQHSLVLCFTQSESQEVCTPPINVIVDCGSDTECGRRRSSGHISGNTTLCDSSNAPRIPVHVRGAFGDGATLTITGPGAFIAFPILRHAGNSCVYQARWNTSPDVDGNGGAGTYKFTVLGDNGETLTFLATLPSCQ